MPKLQKPSANKTVRLYDYDTGRMLLCKVMIYNEGQPHVLQVIARRKVVGKIEAMRRSLRACGVFMSGKKDADWTGWDGE